MDTKDQIASDNGASSIHPSTWLVSAGRQAHEGAPMNTPIVPASNFVLGTDRGYARTFYFLVPRLVGAELYSVRMANVHFWLALAGTMLYILAMWGAGVSQGLLWLSLDELGELSFSFKDIMASMTPYYALRLVAGLVFLTGVALMTINLFMTIKGRPTVAVEPPPVAAHEVQA